MRVLIVEDEDGIREGLASYLRHHGLTVHTAPSCAAARAVLATEAVDVMVTDWRLTDGDAAALLDERLQTIVITGCPEEIAAGSALVLRKPVLPALLLDELRSCALRAAPGGNAGAGLGLATLPVDTQDRVRLLLAELDASAVDVDDDGTFVVVSCEARKPASAEFMGWLGGDWSEGTPADDRVPAAGRVCWRGHRDSRPAEVGTVIAPSQPWPVAGAFAIDLHGQWLEPRAFAVLAERVQRARAGGRDVHLLNVPGHLRLFLELTGRGGALPMRACGGPRLPDHQRQLWN